jgi:hypothetical protein
MATSIAGYKGRNWEERLSAFASLYSVIGTKKNLDPCFDYSVIYLVTNAQNPCVQFIFLLRGLESYGKIFWASN